MFNRTGIPNGRGGQAFDAMGGSGYAFLSSQLELLDTDVTDPLQSTTHGRDIDIDLGGGFPQYLTAYATNYATSGSAQYGLQGTENTDIPMIQADIQKGVWNTFIWQAGMFLSYIDLERLNVASRTGQPPPVSLQEMLDDGVKSFWAKDMDRVTYLGWLGQPGLLNNPGVTVGQAQTWESVTTWAAKMALTDGSGPRAILQDINYGLTQTVINSGFNIQDGMADRLLVSFSLYTLLTQPMTLGNVGGFESILQYLERNSVAAKAGVDFKILPLPDPWLAGLSTIGSTNRIVFYKKQKKAVKLVIAQPMQKAMTVPTTRYGPGYETIYNGCCSQVLWKRTTTALYMDGE